MRPPIPLKHKRKMTDDEENERSRLQTESTSTLQDIGFEPTKRIRIVLKNVPQGPACAETVAP